MPGRRFATSSANCRPVKLPGMLMALGRSLGTVLAKKPSVPLPPIPAAAWQIGLGRFPSVVRSRGHSKIEAKDPKRTKGDCVGHAPTQLAASGPAKLGL